MYDARTLIGGDVLPGDDFVLDAALSLKLREAGFKFLADELRALEESEDLQLVLA